MEEKSPKTEIFDKPLVQELIKGASVQIPKCAEHNAEQGEKQMKIALDRKLLAQKHVLPSFPQP